MVCLGSVGSNGSGWAFGGGVPMGGAGLQNPARQLGGNVSFAQSLSGSQPATPLDLSYVPSPFKLNNFAHTLPLVLVIVVVVIVPSCTLSHSREPPQHSHLHFRPQPTITGGNSHTRQQTRLLLRSARDHCTTSLVPCSPSSPFHHGQQAQAHFASEKQKAEGQDGVQGALI